MPDFTPFDPELVDEQQKNTSTQISEQDMESSKEGPEMENNDNTRDESTQTEELHENGVEIKEIVKEKCIEQVVNNKEIKKEVEEKKEDEKMSNVLNVEAPDQKDTAKETIEIEGEENNEPTNETPVSADPVPKPLPPTPVRKPDLTPKHISTVPSVERNYPMILDSALVEGISGFIQCASERRFNLDYSSFIDLVQASYQSAVTYDRALKKHISSSMYQYYCVVLLWKRLYYVIARTLHTH
ncbi:hypothetical protein RR48_06951 [Papilio machaon]|uniref:Uncharacterized protein n=1 Tax=Papilio machaon TaxID=76193 RepID=A0A194RE43_PAPMA|nr:hypothetical protein RR48_06951 [Papilio machaon]